jgi:hypothetical protein
MQGGILPDDEDRRAQTWVLIHVIEVFPGLSHEADLLRELTGDSRDFAERDRIERAIEDLIGVGLLHRYDELLIPTRAAMRAYEVLED